MWKYGKIDIQLLGLGTNGLMQHHIHKCLWRYFWLSTFLVYFLFFHYKNKKSYPCEFPIPTVGTAIDSTDPFWNSFEIQNGLPLDAATPCELKSSRLANYDQNGTQGGIYSFAGDIGQSRIHMGPIVTTPVV